MKLPHVNKNPLARKQIFVQTPFSHSTLKLKSNFTPQNHSLFRSISCFGVTKINTPIWFQKSWKCEQIFKKAPQYNSNSLICKNIAEPSPEKQPKKLNENLRITLPDQQTNWTMPAKTQTKSPQNLRNKQSNKLNKKKLNATTLEAFTPKAKFDPFKNSYFKNMFITNFCLWSKTWKKSLEGRLTQKLNSIANFNENLLKTVISYLRNHFCVYKGDPLTQFQA